MLHRPPPIACFGKSHGDEVTLEYTTIDNPCPIFGLIFRRTDAARDHACDVKQKSMGKRVAAFGAATKYGRTDVDMKDDWNTVFHKSK